MNKPFTWAAETHVGLHRTHNEDRYAVFSCPIGEVFVVCDGMGGHAAGDIAATLAVEKIKELLSHASPRTYSIPYWLRRAFFHASQSIYQYSRQNYGVDSMGTTAGLLLITPEGEAWWAHTGDSRIYYMHGDALYLLTHDHSFVSFLVDAGHIRPEEAFGHPHSNQLLFSLGTTDGYFLVEVSTFPIHIQKGDLFLLCSDGVSGLLPEDILREKLRTGDSPSNTVRSLIEGALAAGGYDNATALLVKVTGEKRASLRASPRRVSLWGALLIALVVFAGGVVGGWYLSRHIPFDLSPKIEANPADSLRQMAPRVHSLSGDSLPASHLHTQ